MPGVNILGAELTRIYTAVQLGNISFRTGHKYYDVNGRPHRFVKYNDGAGNNPGVAGLFVARMGGDALKGEVTCDLDDSEALVNLPGGQLRAALTDGTYGFVTSGGPNAVAATTDTNVALDSVCVLDSSSVGGIKPWASGLGKACAVARDADAAAVQAIGDLIITCEDCWE